MHLVKIHCKVLRSLIQAQMKPEKGRYAVIDPSSGAVYSCDGFYYADVQRAMAGAPAAMLPRITQNELEEILDYLAGNRLIRRAPGGPAIHVTQDGWYHRSIRLHDFMQAVVTHIVFPSVVAFLTTIITLMIK